MANRKIHETVGRVLAAGKAQEATVCLERLKLDAEELAGLVEAVTTEIVYASYVYTHAQQTQEPAQADKGIRGCRIGNRANKTKAAISSSMAMDRASISPGVG